MYICEACGTDISIHALREEGDICCVAKVDFAFFISIHALREEGDCLKLSHKIRFGQFLSTPSARRATCCFVCHPDCSEISIHALREEGDYKAMFFKALCKNFYPRPPRGGRPNTAYQRAVEDIFLSTPSARRATVLLGHDAPGIPISIHALREEGDCRLSARWCRLHYFYPRPPRGGRLDSFGFLTSRFSFLSTPSARRATKHSLSKSRG